MHASTLVAALFAAVAVAAPGVHPSSAGVPQPSIVPQPSAAASAAPSAVPSAAGTGSGSGSGTGSGTGSTCNILSCAIALGPAGLKCVEFAFGGNGPQCMHAILQDVEQMPSACASCLNALFGQ